MSDLESTPPVTTDPSHKSTDISATAALELSPIDLTRDGGEGDSTMYVELDVNALARSASTREPISAAPVADATNPAEQALELAAVRAELKRYMRESEDLQRAVRLRDGWLQNMREELAQAQERLRTTTRDLSEAQSRVAALNAASAEKDGRINSLEAEVQRLHAETRVGIPEELELTNVARQSKVTPTHLLVPVDHDGESIELNRKVMTIGRTAENDIVVPSSLVSRDHARLLVSASGVTIFDIGSVNGCFVNERRVKKQVLQEGDLLRIADRGYRFTSTDAVRRAA